jgi:lipopolysaccharide export system permease protein
VSIRLLRPLDRYILGEFLRTFVVTALGFPLLVIVIELTDNLGRYLARDLTASRIALSYVYYIPQSLFMVLPASVLFATVFTIGSLTRHSELTAAKASGISFYRVIAPLAIGAMIATGIGLVVGELVPIGTARRNAIIAEKTARSDDTRFGYAYAADEGRVYTIGQLDARPPGGHINQLEIRRGGTGPDFPTFVTIANDGEWTGDKWHLHEGVVHIIPSDSADLALHYVLLIDHHMTERPSDLLQKATQPEEMQRDELVRYIGAMQRSGVDVNPTRVDLMLRIAIPATCMIIFLFGAPLASSNPRGGAAFGVGIALATTVVFLMLVQLTKAVGGKGMLTPELAAWIPSLVFGSIGLVLLARVRT